MSPRILRAVPLVLFLSVGSPARGGQPFSYVFKAGASAPLSHRLDGAVTYAGMGLSMNGSFSVVADSNLRILSVDKNGVATMETALTRLRASLSFPLLGVMSLDTASSETPSDPRAAQAQTQAMLKAYRAQWAPVVQKSGYQP